MRKTQRLIMMGVALLTLVLASCNRTAYDEENYRKLIRYLSPIDSVDQRHTWSLTESHTYRFTANAGSNIVLLRVMNGNPLSGGTVEVMNQLPISKGSSASVTVSMPSVQNTLYAALVDEDGNYYVTSFSKSDTDIDFSDATSGKPGSSTSIVPQTYTYLFEENFPEPGDYDYNDLVLRIGVERTGEKKAVIHVTIAAVGAEKQLAGGIRLIGYRFQDIDSVKTTTGESFNDNIPTGSLYMFDKTDMLIEGRNKEAILNLFVDAHWAMAFNVATDYGLFKRMKYNVSWSTGDGYQSRAIRTLSYEVYFNTDRALNSFTLDAIDPFIMTQYVGGTKWETHLDNFRDAQVLYEYNSSDVKDLPWALMVPSRDFHYPLEGVEMGFKKRTSTGVEAMFGAYVVDGHSFGQWAENYQSNLDWYEYQYANTNYVW